MAKDAETEPFEAFLQSFEGGRGEGLLLFDLWWFGGGWGFG